jgi:hypothetical protein
MKAIIQHLRVLVQERMTCWALLIHWVRRMEERVDIILLVVEETLLVAIIIQQQQQTKAVQIRCLEMKEVLMVMNPYQAVASLELARVRRERSREREREKVERGDHRLL